MNGNKENPGIMDTPILKIHYWKSSAITWDYETISKIVWNLSHCMSLT